MIPVLFPRPSPLTADHHYLKFQGMIEFSSLESFTKAFDAVMVSVILINYLISEIAGEFGEVRHDKHFRSRGKIHRF